MIVKPVVFGSETCAKTEMDMNRLGTWERKILRRIYVPAADQGTWSLKTNQELRELYKDLDIVADIKKKRIDRTGHVVKNGSWKDN
jgi:hypothetical protein